MGVKGVKEYANFMKELGDARAIRQKIISCFERANNPSTPIQEKERLLRFVIVGAGIPNTEID
jgi:NADH:ubiquinone reductase (non-electrogenic)